MIRVWDGFLSLVAALVTAAVIGVPAWAAFQAIRADLVWVWAAGPVVLLVAAGAVMALSFLRKAGRGVHPMRERRRS